MKTKTKFLSFVLCAVLVVTSCFAFASCGKKDETFKIGVSGPLTGGAATYGIAVKNGAALAVKEINAKGGLFGKYQLQLFTYDDQHNATLVSTGYYDMVQKGMQASLGCVTSAPCAEFADLSAEDNMFFITPSASNDEIPKNTNGYQLCFSVGIQGKGAAAYVEEAYSGKTIGLLYCSGDNYSEGIKDQFKENLKTVTVVEASFNDGDTDFSSQVNALKDCEFVFMPIYYTPASQFMTEAKKTANNFKVFYGCDGFDGIETGVEGFDINSVPQKVSYLSHFNAKATEGKAKTFIDAYKAEYNEEPIQFGAAAYDCVYAIVAAIESKGEENFKINMSASDVCDLLTSVFNSETFTYSGATGSNMKWNKAANNGYGYVDKSATEYVVKEAN
ncbi:MAG: ABC transporter substrate-binding protein [Clostridia bacterium]|nr:ABC transporter substrate-binding protein [Clostridia bacterium]